jgi:hypothetical protein
MTEDRTDRDYAKFPDLMTTVGVPGTVRQAEVGGVGDDTGVYIAILAYSPGA